MNPEWRGRSLQEELALAKRMVDEASEIALGYFQKRELQTEYKTDGSPVTKADVAVERALLATLAAERPDDSVFGEETGVHGRSSWQWIIDPIDGTSHFVAGEACWGTHVALVHEGELALGVISRPARGGRWWATRGGGAFRTQSATPEAVTRLRVSDVTRLNESRVSLWVRQPNERLDRLERHVTCVSPHLDDMLRLAEGKLEAVIDVLGKPWDHAPVVVLVEEAGGRFQDRFGGHRMDAGEGCYTNGHINDALRAVLYQGGRA